MAFEWSDQLQNLGLWNYLWTWGKGCLFFLYSFLTPPFGFALFYLRGVAPPEVTTGQIYRSVAPFIVIQLLMLGLPAYRPVLATWLPKVVYG